MKLDPLRDELGEKLRPVLQKLEFSTFGKRIDGMGQLTYTAEGPRYALFNDPTAQ